MSVRITSLVWEASQAKGSPLLVLLAIADHAHDDGGSAYPSIASLAAKTRLSERAVQYAISELTEIGELEVDPKAGPHGVNVFRVLVQRGVQTLHPRKPASEMVQPSARVVQTSVKDGEAGCTQTVIEPSEEPSEEPSAATRERVQEPLPLQTDLRQVMDAWTNATGTTVTALVADAMAVALEDLPLDWVLDAIKETGMAGVRHWKYTQAILNRWQQDGREVSAPPGSTPPGPMQRALATRPDQTRDEMLAAGFKPRFKRHTFGSQGGDP